MASDDLYVFGEDEATRISRAVRKSEEPDPVVSTPKRLALPPQGIIRAVLMQPLYGHGSALAIKSRRVREYQQQDVQLVGAFEEARPLSAAWFRLAITWDRKEYISNQISVSASPDEFLAALAPWTFAAPGDIWVTGGTFTPAEIPAEFPPADRTAYIARWSVTFSGQQFDNIAVPQMEIADQIVNRGGILITFPSVWISTGEVVEVFEGGLMPDAPHTAASPPPDRTPLQPGSAILAAWCPDAEGYVVCSAEARKFRVL